MYTLSIIIPTFLRIKYLKKKIQEVKLLKNEDIEFIFVLEREDEESLRLIESLNSDKVKVIINNGPHYHSFYLGAEAASGEYLKFMGDDDYLIYENFIKIFNSLKAKNFKYEWLISGGIYYNKEGEVIRKIITFIKFKLLQNFNFSILTLINFIMTPSVIIRKKIFFESGGFDKNYKYAQDYYCWLEVSKKYKPKIFSFYSSGATFDETTFSGSFNLGRYFTYFKKISSYQSIFILNILQFFSTSYIVVHNFILKSVYKFFYSFYRFLLIKEEKIILDSNEKINIVHLTRKFDIKNLGGIEEGIIQLCKSNKSEKFNNYVFACGDTPKDFKIHNINVKLFKTSFILFNSHISLDLILYLIKNYKEFKYLHIHSPWPTIELISHFLKKSVVILTYHADIFKRNFLRYLYYVFYKDFINSKKVKLINISTKKYFENSYLKQNLIDEKKIFFQGMGIEDLTKIKINLNLVSDKIIKFYKEKNKVLLFFGRDRHYKGVETIKFLLENSNYNYFISSPNKSLSKINKSSNIYLTENLNFDEKLFVLKNSYLHLFPSNNRSESLGIALIESQMFSVPAIIYNLNSGSNVIIKNKFNGIIVENNSNKDYFKSIDELLNNDELHSLLCKNSRKNYIDFFNPEKFDNYYKKIEKLDI